MIGIMRLWKFRKIPILGYRLYDTHKYEIFILNCETDNYSSKVRNIWVDDILQDSVQRIFSFWCNGFSMIEIQFIMDLLWF